ncbi:MAG: hypothetical protein JWN01_469 [Patescibacteria group bacterium]|nr:hypothetical protein [Patescibacteria group bacterium]
MNKRGLYLLFAGIGGTIGGLLPGLWGGNDLSGWGIVLSMAGGFIGLWLAYKISN